MQDDRIPIAGEERRDHDRALLVGDADVAHGRLVEDRIDDVTIVRAALREALERGAIGHAGAVISSKPSSSHPVTPPIIFFTGRPSRASASAALSAPLQCGPAQ